MRLPRPIDVATQARVSTEGRRFKNPSSLQSPWVIGATVISSMPSSNGTYEPLRAPISTARVAATKLAVHFLFRELKLLACCAAGVTRQSGNSGAGLGLRSGPPCPGDVPRPVGAGR